MTGIPKFLAYSSARLMTALDIRQTPSSLTPTAPASRNSAISVRSLPFWPTVIAAIGCRLGPPASAARRSISSVTARVSFTGRVFGITQTCA
jgi:hypothetical protein